MGLTQYFEPRFGGALFVHVCSKNVHSRTGFPEWTRFGEEQYLGDAAGMAHPRYFPPSWLGMALIPSWGHPALLIGVGCMKRCAHCDRPIGLVNYKRWGDFYFCCKAHMRTYCFARQQDSR